jgi:hypothetical protein
MDRKKTNRRFGLTAILAALFCPILVAEAFGGAVEDQSADSRVRAAVAELERIDDAEHGKFSLGKNRRWHEAFRKLRESPDATVDRMIRHLKHSDRYVRACAAAVLGFAADRRAIDALVATASDPDAVVRACATQALGRRGDRRAITPLIAALDDKDRLVRRAAAEALGFFREERRIQPLIRSILVKGDCQFCAVYVPIVALVQARVNYAEPLAEPAPWALTQIGRAAVPDLVIALRDYGNRNHRYIRWALAKIGAPAVEPVIGLTKDSDPKIREAALSVLGAIGDNRALAGIAEATNDDDPEVRQAASDALAKMPAAKPTRK